MVVAKETGLLDHIEQIPPLPSIVGKILTMTESMNASADDIARALSEDQAIAAKILRVANSSFYGAGRQVSQVTRAVVMLGQIAIRNLVIGIASRDALSRTAMVTAEHKTMWRHSVAVATASEAIARNIGLKPPEEAFVAGLLHDIGQLAMATHDLQSFIALFDQQHGDVGFLTLEKEAFGLDHTEAGFQILNRWGLPEPMCQIALRHHEQTIDGSDPSARLLAAAMLADTIAQVMGFGFDLPAGSRHRAVLSARYLGLADTDQLQILDGLKNRIDQAVAMFADVDAASQQREVASVKRALWVSDEDMSGSPISQLLLEHCGYSVERVSTAQVNDKLTPDALVILDFPSPQIAQELAGELIRDGHQRVVLLSDETLERRRIIDTGLFHVARVFTAYDVNWVEEQLRHG